jgi:PII-like signaling protein
VSDDFRKLTVYFGERDRSGSRFLADALADVYERHALRTSLLLRGVAGYGTKQHMRSDRRLTLSEDLPAVSVAVDARPRIEAALEDVRALDVEGLVTIETARMAGEPVAPDGQTKLTTYLGRHERIGGRPAHQVVVEQLRAAGVAGATVLLGVDGTAGGVRKRARFFGRNADVPLMVISVGDGRRIASVVPELGHSLATLERVRVLKRDGQRFGEPAATGPLQKLMVYASEQAQHDGHPLYLQLLRRLRAAGAAGATSLRGIWGYHGDHHPHGDTLWQLRRRVPVVTVIVDAPERIADWFGIVDELTASTGLVTSEGVPSAPFARRRDDDSGHLRL